MTSDEQHALDELNTLIRDEVVPQLQMMSARGARQDQRLDRLERWVLMPDDYDPEHPPPGMSHPRDIKLVIGEAMREAIRDVFSWKNIAFVLVVLTTIISFVNAVSTYIGNSG